MQSVAVARISKGIKSQGHVWQRGFVHQKDYLRRLSSLCKASEKENVRGINFLEWSGKLIPQGPIVSGVKNGWKLAWLTLMQELAPQSKDGSFVRAKYSFGKQIGDPEFPVVPGRYCAYLGNPCPWCHRILMAIAIRGLEDKILFTYVKDDPEKASRGGWVFEDSDPHFGCSDLRFLPSPIGHNSLLFNQLYTNLGAHVINELSLSIREVYDVCNPGYTGRCTAPLLVDTLNKKAVCNESSIMLRNLLQVDLPGSNPVNLYPDNLAEEIDIMNEKIYENVNNGVYRSGFATSQSAYDSAQNDLYSVLDELEARLGESRFIMGDKLTEVDVRLYPTIIRFDTAYATIFKCSKRRIVDYPNLHAWLRDIYQIKFPNQNLQIKDTFDADDARRSYSELFPLNPSGIVPSGPTMEDLNLEKPANRGSHAIEDVFIMEGVVVEA